MKRPAKQNKRFGVLLAAFREFRDTGPTEQIERERKGGNKVRRETDVRVIPTESRS